MCTQRHTPKAVRHTKADLLKAYPLVERECLWFILWFLLAELNIVSKVTANKQIREAGSSGSHRAPMTYQHLTPKTFFYAVRNQGWTYPSAHSTVSKIESLRLSQMKETLGLSQAKVSGLLTGPVVLLREQLTFSLYSKSLN